MNIVKSMTPSGAGCCRRGERELLPMGGPGRVATGARLVPDGGSQTGPKHFVHRESRRPQRRPERGAPEPGIDHRSARHRVDQLLTDVRRNDVEEAAAVPQVCRDSRSTQRPDGGGTPISGTPVITGDRRWDRLVDEAIWVCQRRPKFGWRRLKVDPSHGCGYWRKCVQPGGGSRLGGKGGCSRGFWPAHPASGLLRGRVRSGGPVLRGHPVPTGRGSVSPLTAER